MYSAIPYKPTNDAIVYIDVRSPFEFEKGHIPGAINAPILTNEERQTVGTLYVNGDIDGAKRIGLQYGSAKLQGYYDLLCTLKAEKPKHRYVFYCARGGYRSRSIALLLKSLDIPVYWLDGGYKSYRKQVTTYFEDAQFPECIVLHGYTGTGKTQILKALEARKAPVIDLEGAANHKGSHLGAIGTDGYQAPQTFENTLYEQLIHLEQPYCFIESESRKIGRVYIPKPFFEHMKRGQHVLLNAPVDTRVKRLIDEYTIADNFKPLFEASLPRLKPYVAPDVLKRIEACYEAEEYAQLTEMLLRQHYDPQYLKSIQNQTYKKSLSAVSIDACAEALIQTFQ